MTQTEKDIIKYAFKTGLPQEIEIVDIGYLYENFADLITAIHRTEFYHVLWFQEGTSSHYVDFASVEIKPNTILTLSKEVVQQFDINVRLKGKAILFTDTFFCKSDADMKFLKTSILFNDLFSVAQIHIQDNADLFVCLFQLMEAELQKGKDLLQSDILKNYLHNFLLLAERERRKQNFTEVKKGADLDYLILFKDLLEREYRQYKQVRHYANQLGMTEKRLNQATSKILNKSPKQMIDDRVMLEAKRLLAHTNDSAKEIGFDLGFSEPTNFIKFFRNHCHFTPVEFRINLF